MAELREDWERKAALVAFCLALSLSLSQGCARSAPSPATNASSQASEQALPFHPDNDHAAVSEGRLSDPKQAASLPFLAAFHQRILPAGTLLTVQLEDPLSIVKVHAGDVFTATVAAPLTTDRDTLVERGAVVTGRVESARSQADRPGFPTSGYARSGYFRLTLSSITLGGRQLALQTSSLFARGTFQPSEGVGVQKGSRLTFRLTAPVTLEVPDAMANRQSLSPATE
jgi:hypothetical protein